MSQRYRQQRNREHGPVFRPRSGSLGGARRRDVEDDANRERAPRGVRGHYDTSGEREYAGGLERFEHDPHRSRVSSPRWDLDEGGVEFGRSPVHDARPEQGPYGGRGPRGYQRSDERIREDVCDRLTEASDLDASEIEVTVDAGIVTLTGAVDGRIAKRRAEDLAAAARGVHDVQNRLTIPQTRAAGRQPQT